MSVARAAVADLKPLFAMLTLKQRAIDFWQDAPYMPHRQRRIVELRDEIKKLEERIDRKLLERGTHGDD
jgi:hypothetical protein